MTVDLLLSHLRATTQYQSLLKTVAGDTHQPSLGMPRAARLPVLAALHADLNRPILLLTDRADHAVALHDELAFWTEAPRHLFPEPTPLFYEDAAWGANTRRQRLDALTTLARYHLPFAEKPSAPPLMVASARAVMTRTLPRRDFLRASRRIAAGSSQSPEGLVRQWAANGYQHADTVLEPGQFSRRGGLLDIWVPAEPLPARLDFFGDEIETIRRFDPASQRTVVKLESLLVTPAREFLVRSENTRSEDSMDDEEDESRILNPEYSEFHIPILYKMPASILDYLPARALVLVEDISLIETIIADVEEQAVRFRAECIEEETLPPDFPIPYLTWAEVLDSVQSRPWLELGYSADSRLFPESPASGPAPSGETDLRALFTHDQRFAGRLKPFAEYLGSVVERGESVVVVSRQAKRLRELWREHSMVGKSPAADEEPAAGRPSSIAFIEASLSEGFVFGPGAPGVATHLISDSEIFGWERPTPRSRQQAGVEAPEALFADLRVGDYVVHVDHGIGRYAGLMQRSLEGHEREYLAIEYEGSDMVFVPVHQADRLMRYIGAEGAMPALSRLGGGEWSATKSRVREAVRQVAEELLDLYARRQVAAGYAFSTDSQWQKELEDSFPYVETDDQLKGLAEIKRDMESSRPMDRLLCGDVGYGKTEVALRAAFKAVMDGRQVAILVPTTVLAQQHYDTFQQRLAAYPVKVEMLSRFRSPREQDEILRKLLLGQVDIVIGTHRLISPDVEFRDLGLVIIDEEQRFGVTHKEHLKKLRTEVDVLTLTATPIPRTLYMALTGVRDISTLSTPPEERLPIITHVGPYAPRLVRQAILRELERGGQIFFVHNRVQTIHAMAAHLRKLAPEARIAIGHGQMPEHELSDVMHKFTNGEVDILLSTTIVESGLDIPNANTLIVDRADTFGLAQLYQLRGRVGRGAMRAYAYFFRHRRKPPTVDGQERLEVIAENTQLGAGYSIAMRDLEIRGAGELLGMRQSGHIASVGFHLYTRMLAAAVKRLRAAAANMQEQEKDERIHAIASKPAFQHPSFAETLESELKEPVTVDLPLTIGIPRSYIPNQDLRVRLYRRLASLRDEAGVDAFAAEFSDRFGPPPEMVENLFYQMRVKLRADAAGLQSVSVEAGQIALRYPVLSEGMSQRMFSDLGPGIRGGRNTYWCSFLRDDDWQDRLLAALDTLRNRVVEIIDARLLPG